MVVLVGGGKSKSGKTTFIRLILREYPCKFSVIKISPTIKYGEGIETRKEVLCEEGKDTALFLEEPVSKVFWVKGSKVNITKYLSEIFLRYKDNFIIEGNSFLDFSKPDLFIFVKREGEKIKNEAEKFFDLADLVVLNTEKDEFTFDGKILSANLKKAIENNRLFKEYLHHFFDSYTIGRRGL